MPTQPGIEEQFKNLVALLHHRGLITAVDRYTVLNPAQLATPDDRPTA